MLNGAKVKPSNWIIKHYIYYDEKRESFINQNNERDSMNNYMDYNKWEIYEEPKDKKIEKINSGGLQGSLERIKINELIDAVNLLNEKMNDGYEVEWQLNV